MSRTPRPSWMKSFITRYRRDVAAALGLGFLTSACAALLMFTSGYLISKTAIATTTLFSIMIPVACVQLFGFGRPLARYLERLVSHNWVLRVTSDLRVLLFKAAESRIGDPLRERAAGEYLSLLSDDVAHLQNLYLRVVFPTAIAYATALGAALLFGFFSVPFALIMACSFFGIAVLLPYASLLATRARIVRARAEKGDEYIQIVDDVNGATDWVLAGRAKEVATRHAKADYAVRKLEQQRRLVERTITLFLALILCAVLCLVIWWAGTTFSRPNADTNLIAAFALGFFPLIEAFMGLPAARSESTAHDDAIQRLDTFIDTERESAPSALESITSSNACPLSLEHVSYTYPNSNKAALDDITISFERNTSYAVLGRSGAGKSTLAHVIRGALPIAHGRFTIFGQVATMRTSNLSSIIGFIGQDPYLFNRTLRENLSLGVSSTDDAHLIAALESVGLGEKFSSLDDGLDTVIGETGVGFSGGETHRIALARVLIADVPIVIVDEPFSALDPETERDLIDTLLDSCKGRTLIVITHHLAEIERFDHVVFIEDARIDLEGSPEELMRTSERFQTLIAFDR